MLLFVVNLSKVENECLYLVVLFMGLDKECERVLFFVFSFLKRLYMFNINVCL